MESAPRQGAAAARGMGGIGVTATKPRKQQDETNVPAVE
jgi:hypothetical protein